MRAPKPTAASEQRPACNNDLLVVIASSQFRQSLDPTSAQINASQVRSLCVISSRGTANTLWNALIENGAKDRISIPLPDHRSDDAAAKNETCSTVLLAIPSYWNPDALGRHEPEHPVLHRRRRREARLSVSGEGPPLVMSATWLTHLEHQWRSLAWRPWLDAFSRGRKLLRYDARGCGLSDWDASDLSFDNWVSDFECVIEAATFGRFDLLATCWGGPIAITYAARHPERINRLILYGTYALGRLRWNNRPKEIEKARVLLDLTRLAGAMTTTLSSKCGQRHFSRAAPSTTCTPGATSSAQRLPPKPLFVCCRSAGMRMCVKRHARSNAPS